MGLAKQLNERLNEVWADHFSGTPEPLSPKYFLPISPKQLLFVGINPSFSEDSIRKAFLRDGISESPRSYFRWPAYWQSYDLPRELEATLDERRTYKRFWGPHWQIVEALGNPTWDHLDVFPIRMTEQASVSKVLKAQPDLKRRLLELFWEALSGFQPKIVVVANAEASDTLKGNLTYSDELGCYRLHDGTPVFLSGMLTNGAMDKYSKERLIWQLRRVWKAAEQ